MELSISRYFLAFGRDKSAICIIFWKTKGSFPVHLQITRPGRLKLYTLDVTLYEHLPSSSRQWVEKLAHFRIRELKHILTQLGLSKQGKKQDLIDRIIAVLSDERVSGMWSKKNAVGKEEVAKLVDDIYRMSLFNFFCEDPRCNVWQHIACVIIPEKPMEGILPAPPPIFYCELCRLGRADP
ncbi:E3 SUMO-protein ligase SIZ1 isoform X1, partial [Tanacetum coccineum]